MPTKYTAYEPDHQDCRVMCQALARDFSVVADIQTIHADDYIITIVKCHLVATFEDRAVKCQAMVKCPSRHARSLYALQYSALLDCWHQLDRGVLAAAERPIDRGWDGRPRAPRRNV